MAGFGGFEMSVVRLTAESSGHSLRLDSLFKGKRVSDGAEYLKLQEIEVIYRGGQQCEVAAFSVSQQSPYGPLEGHFVQELECVVQ